MLPDCFANYVKCINIISDGKLRGQTEFTCEGHMLKNDIKFIERTQDCDIKEVVISGKNLYEVKMK
jgi:hypothetical protein